MKGKRFVSLLCLPEASPAGVAFVAQMTTPPYHTETYQSLLLLFPLGRQG